MPLSVAHRGDGAATSYIPENTIESFKSALKKGARAVEFDVKRTLDNVLVVFHDNDFKRMSRGTSSRKLHTTTYDEAVDILSTTAAASKKRIIVPPTFEDVLDFFAAASQRNIHLFVEAVPVEYNCNSHIRDHLHDYETFRMVMDVLNGKKYRRAFKDRATVITFSGCDIERYIKQRSSTSSSYPFGLNISEHNISVLDTSSAALRRKPYELVNLPIEMFRVSPSTRAFSVVSQRIARLRSAGKKMGIYTLYRTHDTKDRMAKDAEIIRQWKPDMIFVDSLKK